MITFSSGSSILALSGLCTNESTKVFKAENDKEYYRQQMDNARTTSNRLRTENLRIFATLRGVPNNHAIKDALDLVGLPYKDKKLFSQYSLGMKQRLAIALAVMHDPELLILDEPINGLDPIGIAEVRSFIRELCDARGKTILISMFYYNLSVI